MKKKSVKKKKLIATCVIVNIYLFSYLLLTSLGEYKYIVIELDERNQVSDYVWKPVLVEWRLLSENNKGVFYKTNLLGYFYYPLAFVDIEYIHAKNYDKKIHLMHAIEELNDRLADKNNVKSEQEEAK